MLTRILRSLPTLALLGVTIAAISCVPTSSTDQTDDLQPSQPQALKRLTLIEEPGPLGVGEQLHLPDLATLEGARFPASSQVAGRKALVFVMTSAECPVSMSYGPRLAAIEAEYSKKQVAFIYVNCVAAETPEDMRLQIKEYGFKGIYLSDRDRAIASSLGAGGARTTTEVFVLDPGLTLVYRGAVDDRFGVGATLDAPRQQFLRDALDATLAGERPVIGATWAPGCLLDTAAPTRAPVKNLTYFGRISRILEESCVGCHRPLGPAPFSLASYQSIQGRLSMIDAMVSDGLMPPSHGHAVSGSSLTGAGGPWATPRMLSAEDRSDLLAWLRSNRPIGTFDQAPTVQDRPQGWSIGTPELLLTAGPLLLPVDGPIQYERFIVPTSVKTDRWISELEFRPMKQELIHHAMVWILSPGATLPELGANVLAAGTGKKGSNAPAGMELLGAYGPGQNIIRYPPGVARRLPAGSLLLVDLYSRPAGKVMNASLRIGIQFAKEPPRAEVRSIVVQNTALKIEAGNAAARNSAEVKLDLETKVLAMTPYMRWRGKSLSLDAAPSASAKETSRLLDAPRYDPRWQIRHEYADPMTLRAGTRLRLQGIHDNSAGNPNNPDANRQVATGAGSGDEALLVALEVLVPVPASKEK